MKHILKHFACLFVALLCLGQVWADEVTFNYSDYKGKGTSSSGSEYTMADKDDVTIGDTKFYGNNSYAHFYASGVTTITPASGVTITQIVLTASATNYNGYQSSGTVTASAGTVSGGTTSTTVTWEGSATTAFTISHNKQIRWTSIVVTYSKESGVTPTCATPTFSPAAGSYEGTQNVTISSTSGATIYYTTDGTDPKTSGTKQTYSAAISVAADMTIKAYATLTNYDDSDVATAAYTITEGPDVTLNLIDGNWGFPTSNTTEDGTYTNSVSGYSVTCHAPTNYKVSGSDYFFIGKSGAYILLPEFTSPIEKIVVSGNSGGAADVAWNIYQGETAVSTAASGCKNDAYTFDIAPANQKANVAHAIKVTNAKNLQIKVIKIYYAAAAAVAKPTISGDENFVTSTTVTLACETANNTIYYTTDGTDPKSGSAYSAPFTLTNTATVRAIAKVGDDWSAEATSKTFTKVTALTTMADVQAEAGETEKGINVTITNWVVTAVSGSQVWLTDADNTKGILLYKSSHGFTAGKKLNGTVIDTKIKLYNLYPELTSLTVSEVTVTDAEAITPRTPTIAELLSGHPAEQGTVVKLEGVTYESSALTDGVNSIAADNKFFSSLALVEGTTYNITGVVTYYKNGDDAVVKIAPRSADDVEAQSAVVTPTAANLAALKAATRGTYILTLTNAMVTYVNGNNAFIEDETGGALIYFASHGYSAGDCLNGDYQVTTADYQGKFEITAMEAQAGAAKTTAEIPLTTVSIATLNASFSSYESRRVKIAGANVTDAISGSDRNGAINDGAALAVYAAAGVSTITLTADDNVDIIGYPGFHNTDQQLNVWAQADITVNEKDAAGIAFTPASETITGGDAWSAPEFTNPNGLDVTFNSDDETVATVSNAGVVSLEGGYGTAVITAHTDGDATHNAGNATYTITVNDPASVDTRKVAESPAPFTAPSGNLDPDDIAFEAFKGGANNDPAIYNSGIRLYQISGSNTFGGFITLTAKLGCTIDEVQITTTNTYATTVAYSKDGNENLLKSESVAKSGSYTTGTGLNASSVNILNKGTGSSGRLEIASIKVYYTGESATIDHYELGGTYATVFEVGNEFNHDGLIVYAAFDALGENKTDITSSCTFSTPDMSTEGEKAIEITYNDAVVKSYTITVNASTGTRKVANSPAAFTTTSGDMTPNDITFAANQGRASTAPGNYNNGIRLYQAPSASGIGGYITLKAKKGCTIDQVKITTTNTYATTVAYSVDGNENLLGSESVAKSGEYSTPTGLNVESVNIVNKGTSSSGRLEIASVKVWYTGDALAVDHYILGGSYETTFEQFGTFSYEGLTVTAAYNAGETITEPVTGFTVEADLSTAGAAKANVMLNSVKIAEYDITVTASAKTDPELAYDPASVILTFGQSLSAPEFSNDHNVSPITYSSDKPAVATVDAEGNIALAGGTGVAVITASFAGDDDYIASKATFTITVNEPAEDLSGAWVKATSVAAGDRIIIGATVSAGTKTMGLQNTNNRAAVASTLADGVLTPAEGTKTFLVVDAGDGKFALQALNGKYLTSATSGTSNNLLEAANYDLDNAKWTISIDGEGVASIVAAAGNRTYMQYNNGSTLFSCYQYATSQSPINIYKKESATPPTPDYGSYQRDVTAGNYGTICLPKAGIISGAILFDVASFENGMIYFEEVNDGAMEAGIPYIFYATSEQLNVTYTSGTVENEALSANGLYGFYDLTDPDAQYDLGNDAGNYILYQNQYWLVKDRAAYVANYRAYIKIGMINYVAPTPGRRRVAMTVNGEQVATGIDAINASDKPMKVMIDGQLFILRGEKMYNVTGSLVK